MEDKNIVLKKYNPSRYEQHKSFGGGVCFSDFCTFDCNGTSINRVVSALSFDSNCRRNIQLYRDRKPELDSKENN